MPIKVSMPRLSDTMESGTVIKWNVSEGDSVEPGDVLADIETDKATMELQAYDEGTVARIILNEGDSVAVGKTIMILAEEGEDADEAASGVDADSEDQEQDKKEGGEKDKAKGESKKGEKDGQKKKQSSGKQREEESEDQGEEETQTAVKEREKSSNAQRTSDKAGERQRESSSQRRNGRAADDGGEGGRIFASPLAKKIADDEGVDLSSLEGSGPSGRIVRADVEAAIERGGAPAPGGAKADRPAPARAASQTPAPILPSEAGLEEQLVALSNMRKTIARRLVESKTSIPHYQVTISVNMDPLLELRAQLNEQLEPQGVKLSVNDFLVRACAVAMHQHQFVNSQWVEEGDDASIQVLGHVNIGVAIALPMERGGGLVVATLRDTDRMGLRQISQQTKALADKARTRGLTIEEISDSTFTISNLGMFGVDHFNAIINPPNTAILAVGQAAEKPVVRDGALTIGREMAMTMSSDHRVVDGAMAAQYLGTVKELMEHPATLLV